jgi:ArsR family transcriptional regulator, lead/cadmium/zinc/bismuth-responsive transcriptional repressor
MGRPRKIDQIREPEQLDSCAEQIVHVDAVRCTRASMPEALDIGAMSALFAAIGDPTRLKIVAALSQNELCVCDIAASLGISQSAISHQLRTLRELGLVRARRDGRLSYYALDDEHVSTLYSQALDHIRHRTEVAS